MTVVDGIKHRGPYSCVRFLAVFENAYDEAIVYKTQMTQGFDNFVDCDLRTDKGVRLTDEYYYARTASPFPEERVVKTLLPFGISTFGVNPLDHMPPERLEQLKPGIYRFRLTIRTPKRLPAVSNWMTFTVNAADIRDYADYRELSDLWLKRPR